MKLTREHLQIEPKPRAADAATMSEERKRYPFNPERELWPEDRVQIQKYLQNLIESIRGDVINPSHSLQKIMEISLIYPELTYKMLEEADDIFELSNKRTVSQGTLPMEQLNIRANLTLLFPDKKEQVGLGTSIIFNTINVVLDQVKKVGGNEYPRLLLILYILFPERRAELKLDHIHGDVVDNIEKGMSWGVQEWALRARSLALLYPDRSDQQICNPEEYQRILEQMQHARETGAWAIFVELAASLRIITADEAAITEQGIEIINHDELDQKSALPERNLVQ